MKKVFLFRDYWTVDEPNNLFIAVTGWAEYNAEIIGETMLVKALLESNINSFKGFSRFVRKLNGSFSIIFATQDSVYVGADRMRGYPVNYYYKDGEWVITDDIIKYQEQFDVHFNLDNVVCEQFLFSNYVFGPYTVYRNVFSVQAGETISLSNNKQEPHKYQYFKWAPNMKNSEKLNEDDEAGKQDTILLNVFERMIKSAPNVNNWVIPLSGGYDSRTIVNYLYKLGLKNVICFSYGFKNNIESQISQKVAEALGYKWYFMDYSKWVPGLHRGLNINEYMDYGFNGTSNPHPQDLPAVYGLKESNLLNKGDVFVPGHALEVLAGSHVKVAHQECYNIDMALTAIKGHYSRFGNFTEPSRDVVHQIKKIILDYIIDYNQIPECFDWKERQTKYIANSVKVYEFFGYKWRLPQWDNALFDYWSFVSFNNRYRRGMYKSVFNNNLVVKELKDIPIAQEITKKTKPTLMANIVKMMPLEVKKLIKNYWRVDPEIITLQGFRYIYNNYKGSISSHTKPILFPENINKHLVAYPQRQPFVALNVNSITTILRLIRLYQSSNDHIKE